MLVFNKMVGLNVDFATLNLCLAAILALGSLVILLEFWRGHRQCYFLRDIAPAEDDRCPSLAVVIAARNEARNIREALQSILALDYPGYRIVLVNDRSTDETGIIADELAREHDHLEVVHIHKLPPGWLGKNHALYVGARATQSELILFTDADIVMQPDAPRRAVSHMQAQGLDMLAVTPEFETTSLGLDLFFPHFTLSFGLFARPWMARDPKSSAHIGIGAFNLIRREAYETAGTHRAIALRPDDDIKLGKIVKMHGFREDYLFGNSMISVEWYTSLPEAIRGLMKNAFAGLEYNLPLALSGALAQAVFFIWPWFAALLSEGPARWLYVLAILCQLTLAADSTKFHGIKRWAALGQPFGALIIVYIILRGAALNLFQGGIYWRDTFYPLAELRKNRV